MKKGNRRKRILQAIRAFERTHEAFLFRGTMHPDNWNDIAMAYKRGKEKLVNQIYMIAKGEPDQ